jgi:hypothetical protein
MPSNTTSRTLESDARLPRLAPTMRKALLLAYLWLNASEIFRYFLFVTPMMRESTPQIADVAPMNLPVFMIWGVWDTLLFLCVATIVWLYLERFGGGLRSILEAGTLLWAAVFCIFWLGLWNMNLTAGRVPLTALPLAWLEMVLAAAIVEWGWRRSREAQPG